MMAFFLFDILPGDYAYAVMPQDGDLEKVRFEKPYMGLAHITPQGRLGGAPPVSAEHMPTRFRWEGPRRKRIPDYLIMNGMLGVSKDFKDAVESLEPGKHQFFPVILEWRNGEPACDMFVFICTTTLYSVHEEKSTVPPVNPENPKSILDIAGSKDLRLFLSARNIGGHHIWRDAQLVGVPLVSEKLAHILQSEKMIGIRLDPIAVE